LGIGACEEEEFAKLYHNRHRSFALLRSNGDAAPASRTRRSCWRTKSVPQ